MRQDVSWYDQNAAGSLISKLSQNVSNIELGIGTKLGEFIQFIIGAISGLILSFAMDWRLSIGACLTLPLLVLTFTSFGWIGKHFTKKELDAYTQASAISAEVLGAIRTVVAFGGEKKEAARYCNELESAKKAGIQKATMFGGGKIKFCNFNQMLLLVD